MLSYYRPVIFIPKSSASCTYLFNRSKCVRKAKTSTQYKVLHIIDFVPSPAPFTLRIQEQPIWSFNHLVHLKPFVLKRRSKITLTNTNSSGTGELCGPSLCHSQSNIYTMFDFKKSRTSDLQAELPPLYLGHKRPFSDFVEFYQLEGQAAGGLRTANSSTTAVSETYYYYDPDSEKDCDCGHGIPDCPDGGSQAWLVVLGGFLTYFATFGNLHRYSFRSEIS